MAMATSAENASEFTTQIPYAVLPSNKAGPRTGMTPYDDIAQNLKDVPGHEN